MDNAAESGLPPRHHPVGCRRSPPLREHSSDGYPDEEQRSETACSKSNENCSALADSRSDEKDRVSGQNERSFGSNVSTSERSGNRSKLGDIRSDENSHGSDGDSNCSGFVSELKPCCSEGDVPCAQMEGLPPEKTRDSSLRENGSGLHVRFSNTGDIGCCDASDRVLSSTR